MHATDISESAHWSDAQEAAYWADEDAVADDERIHEYWQLAHDEWAMSQTEAEELAAGAQMRPLS